MNAEKLNGLNELNGTDEKAASLNESVGGNRAEMVRVTETSNIEHRTSNIERNNENVDVGNDQKAGLLNGAGGAKPLAARAGQPGEKVPAQRRVDGKLLLDELEDVLQRYVVLPAFAAETLALWVVHTYAFELRDVSTYLGIESPEKRCGKTTLLGVLAKLANRPVAATNISSSAFFRVIEEMRPTLLIDEADTFLRGNDSLRGILNAGYTRETAYVIRTSSETRNSKSEVRNKFEDQNSKTEKDEWEVDGRGNGQPQLARFSCWCPKVMAAIGKLPETLADRCIVIRMERKLLDEECERLRNLETNDLRERCARFVQENEQAIARAHPEVPDDLHDRAADVWEPLLALADLAGGEWPERARRAAEGLTERAQGNSGIGALLFDIYCGFTVHNEAKKLLSRDLVGWLNRYKDRPWMDLPGLRTVDCGKRKEVTDLWLSRQLRPYGVRTRNIRDGENVAKGYVWEEMEDVVRRYVPRYEVDAFMEDLRRRDAERKGEVLPGQDTKS